MKVFISYSLDDRNEAGQLCDRLNLIGFNCFLAHADIPKGAEWHNEIIGNLKTANVFIPILTEKAMESPWVMQECGMAHLLRVNRRPLLIIPLMVDRDDPPGCISIYQSIRVGTKFWSFGKVKMEDELTLRLAAEIIKQTLEPEMLHADAIRNLRGASWDRAQYIVQFLYQTKRLTYHEFIDVIANCSHNFAVAMSDVAMSRMFRFLEWHRAELEKNRAATNAWNQIYKRYKARKDEERRQHEEMLRTIRESQKKRLAEPKADKDASVPVASA